MTQGTAVSIWVGIDGYNPLAPPVVQAGIDVEYGVDGSLIYKAWTEVSCSSQHRTRKSCSTYVNQDLC